MTEVSIAEAKNHLPRLVQQAETGGAVHITRRGRPVAVLLSEQEYARLNRPRRQFGEFLTAWRVEMRQEGIEFPDGSEFEGLRDKAPGREVDFA
jgi:prevent-host-death family protein